MSLLNIELWCEIINEIYDYELVPWKFSTVNNKLIK